MVNLHLLIINAWSVLIFIKIIVLLLNSLLTWSSESLQVPQESQHLKNMVGNKFDLFVFMQELKPFCIILQVIMLHFRSYI